MRLNKLKKNNKIIIELIGNSRKGISQYYDSKTCLFNKLITDREFKKEKKSLLLVHSLISLIGISNHKKFVDIDYEKSVDMLYKMIILQDTHIREVSLLLWLLAKENDSRAEKIYKLVDKFPEKIFYYADTMELAWLLTALIFEFRRNNSNCVKLKLNYVLQLLVNRFNERTGLFFHRDRKKAYWDFRYNISNFADEIYSIYALSEYSQITAEERYLEIADICVSKITSLQGQNGQWWWHYNALTGEVVQKYPVFSVHQDSMAPFALMSLSKMTRKNYNSYISLGLHWLVGHNELGINMINKTRNFIRRGIKRAMPFSKLQNVVTVAYSYNLIKKMPEKYDNPRYLRLMDWEYSYHLGWVLYAYNEKNKNLWNQF